jgi:DNA helicase-2/ATP-dependent DNA helicase PcrA
MDLLADLTPPQREAVTTIQGPLLVLAGAGSGKTRVITRRIAYMLERGIRGSSILAITFTNKAAGEMKSRVEAIAPNSGVVLGTFHSLCARLLRTYAPLVGLDRSFTIYDQGDRLRAVKDVMERMKLDELSVSPEKVDQAISKAKNDLITPETLARRGGDHVSAVAAQVFAAYQERLRESSSVDFDDLLGHMVTILKTHKDVRAELDARFRYVMVDEYQDTNLAQYAIVRGLSVDHPNLCVTGDPDQSIYGWRGANLSNILDFEKDYPGTKVVKLERNYRSTKNILLAADTLIKHNRRRKPKQLLTENPHGSPIQLTLYPDETEEARGIAGKIVEIVHRGEYTFRDVAVFVRMTALTRVFEQAFRQAKIPYQVVGGVSYYERQEVKDVLAYLNLLANPKDDVSFNRVVNVPPRGIGKTSLDHLATRAEALKIPLLAMAREAANVPGLKEKAARSLRDFSILIDELYALREYTAEEVIRKLLDLTGYRKALQSETDGKGEERLANLDELISAARDFDREHVGGTVVEFLEEISLASSVDRWKDDSGAVTLMTLHAAKGLEFPVVFIVALEQGLLPHSRANESDTELEEERRLLFVGITRAERELFLSRSHVREFRGQRQMTIPSQFLMELPEDGIETRDLTGGSGMSSYRRPEAQSRSAPSQFGSGARYMTAGDLGRRTSPASFPALPPVANPNDTLNAFQPGVSVIHPEYGIGRIVAIDGAGPNRKGRVAFTVGGERVFVLAKCPLRPVKR